nr:cell wall-binding repeat-containing protein [Mobiluncus sp. Marseille-Q7826]
METYSHVVKKMRRAGIVSLFAVGLAFTGVAPANALSGLGWQTGDLGKNGTAVAQIAVPLGGKDLKYKTCTGVLVSKNEVLTSTDCFSLSNDPYEDIFNRGNTKMEDLATKTARVTFGKDATSTTGADKRVYFSVRVETPTQTAYGLSIVQLDRDVQGIEPVTKATGVVQDGTKVNMVGWETTDFVPAPGASAVTINNKDKQIAFRATGKYEVSPMTWEHFQETSGAIPRLDIPSASDRSDIVPAFKIDGTRVSKDTVKELGTPVITTDGKLQGLLVGYSTEGAPVFMDTGEANISDWIYRKHVQRVLEKKAKASDDTDLAKQYTDLRDVLCSRVDSQPAGPLDVFKHYAETNQTDTKNSVISHNERITKLANAYPTVASEINQSLYKSPTTLAPNYEIPGYLDPKYIKDIAKEPAELLAMCTSADGTNPLDMAIMYQRALADQKVYDNERAAVQSKIDDAEKAKNEAQTAYDKANTARAKAEAIYNVDPADTANRDAWKAAAEEANKAKEDLDSKTKAYEVQLELKDQLVKHLDPVVTDAVGAVKTGLSAVRDKVETAQNNWLKEDDAFRTKYARAMTDYLTELRKQAENVALEADNATHCHVDPATSKTVCDSGYPKKPVPVNQTILDKDPYNTYLVKGAGESVVQRNLDSYYKALNETVPIMLEARYQIWNMNRMTELLKKGGILNDADRAAMRQEIKGILANQNELMKRISNEYGQMQGYHSDLVKMYEAMPGTFKQLMNDQGYEKAIKDYNNANLAYNGAESDQKNLREVRDELADPNITAQKMDSLLDKANKAFFNLTDILNKITKASEDMKNLNSYGKLVNKNLVKPNLDDPTWDMNPNQKKAYEEALAKQKAAEEKAAALEKAEADKKKAAEEAKKKAEEKDKKDKSEKDKKKDEQDKERLARALSKNTLRADGSDRVLTAIAAWKMGNFPGDSVVLVDGNVHADGLSATPLAAALHAPVLLTTWKTGLEPALLDQLKVSGKKNVYLVGGQVPMNPYDEFELNEAGMTVHRIAGPDRFGTAVAVNQMTEPLVGAAPKKPLNLYIADGVGFPDALVAGAAAGRTGSLMLLSKGNTLDPNTFGYISALGQTRPLTITAVGGPAVHAVQNTPWPTTMSVNIKPVMGKDRYETAALTAGTQAGTTAAVLVTGQNFPDALSGGALAVDQNAALVLTKTEELPPSSYQALQRYGANKTIVVGGPGAVSAKVAELVNGAALENPDSVNVTGTLKEREEVKAAAAAKLAELQERKLEAIKKGDWDTLAEIEKENQKAQSALSRYSTPSRAAGGMRTPASAGTNNSLDYVQSLLRSGNSMQDVFNKMGVSSISQLAHLISTGSPTSASMPYPNPTFS